MRRGALAIRKRRGAASVLIILLLVLLVFFAVLPLAASGAGLRLSRRRADWNTRYYQLDTRGEMLYARVDRYCRQTAGAVPNTAADRDALQALVDGGEAVRSALISPSEDGWTVEATLALAAEDRQQLVIKLEIRRRPAGDAGSHVSILRWSEVQQPPAYDDKPGGVWQG